MPGGHSREVWEEVCRWGVQTPTLFRTKIAYFATLFKTDQDTKHYFLSLIYLFCIQNEVVFHTKIVETDIEEKIIGIANVDRSSQVFALFERLPV